MKYLFLLTVSLLFSNFSLAQNQQDTINTLLDSWHKAAAQGDENIFFGLMSEGAIYLGTDASERWTKAEFEAWSKPFFEKDKAWNFKPLKRFLYFDSAHNICWFDEQLDTWMGICRGSGVLTRSKDGAWQITHYNLSMLIPNDKVNAVLTLLKGE